MFHSSLASINVKSPLSSSKYVSNPSAFIISCNSPEVEWNSDKDNVDAKRYFVRLARLLAYLRGVVPTWHTRDTQGSNYGYGMAVKEECIEL